MKVLRKYQAFDGTKMVVYRDNNGAENTVPLWVYKKSQKQNNMKKLLILISLMVLMNSCVSSNIFINNNQENQSDTLKTIKFIPPIKVNENGEVEYLK